MPAGNQPTNKPHTQTTHKPRTRACTHTHTFSTCSRAASSSCIAQCQTRAHARRTTAARLGRQIAGNTARCSNISYLAQLPGISHGLRSSLLTRSEQAPHARGHQNIANTHSTYTTRNIKHHRAAHVQPACRTLLRLPLLAKHLIQALLSGSQRLSINFGRALSLPQPV